MGLTNLLYAWWRRAARPPANLQVVLYTRRGCHLCEQAWDLLEKARRRSNFALTAVDVDGNPELVALYGECVPVVTVNGVVRFRGVVNPVLLDRLLRAEANW
jgi:glutaredoxin